MPAFVSYCTTVRTSWSSTLFSRNSAQPHVPDQPSPPILAPSNHFNPSAHPMMPRVEDNRNGVVLGEKRESRRLRDGERQSMQPRHCVPHMVTARKPETPKSSARVKYAS